MPGHGSPRTSNHPLARQQEAVAPGRFLLALAVALTLWSLGADPAAAQTTRVRIAWGGGAERVWTGQIELSQGTLAEPRLLGIEADEPGSMWLKDGRLNIASRSGRTYDGIDLLAIAPDDAVLRIRLTPGGRARPKQNAPWIEVPLSQLDKGFHNAALDDQGNRLLVRRAGEDTLRIALSDGRDSLIFSPGEQLDFQLTPRKLPFPPKETARIDVRLLVGRGDAVLWATSFDVLAGNPVARKINVPLPTVEGVYDLQIKATQRTGLGVNLLRRAPSIDRRLQLLMLSPHPLPVPVGLGRQWTQVEEIDPANPKWYEQFAKLPQLPGLPRLWSGPLGNDSVQTVEHSLGRVVMLGAGGEGSEVGWEAYSLPIERPGQPHVLEIEYPNNVPQTMNISIIEPNASGAVMPIGLDSGVFVPEEVGGIDPPAAQWARHRLIFWPRTKTPMVLVTNGDGRLPAMYGKIRVLTGGDRLPRAFPAALRRPERLLAAYFDRPLFPENFSATEARDQWSKQSLDDWLTFYQGGTRLVEYLHHVGYGGMMMSVLADGSTIYPSKILQPTPRYDKGVLFSTGQDAVRKDVLEMLMCLFDREELELIPALDFDAPLPRLEAVLRAGGAEAEGIRWIGADGTTWQDKYRSNRGRAPYYNVLHPTVQEAMLEVVREIVTRYDHHESFAGLAIKLSAYGYTQLPGPRWGMDDVTIARFERDTGVAVPGTGESRFAQRAEFLNTQARREWLQWRADKLAKFFIRVQSEFDVADTRSGRRGPGRRLYLAGAEMLAGEELEGLLRPTLLRRTSLSEAMLQVGIDVHRHFGDPRSPILLRPERVNTSHTLGDQAMDLIIEQMADAQHCFSVPPIAGSLFFHKPHEMRLASFDQKSPFQPTHTWLATQTVPSMGNNRRRFVRGLAAFDSRRIFDGGWRLPLGQEESIRRLVAVYRQLPDVPFERFVDPAGPDRQPVVVRYYHALDRTYVYLVNELPFAVTAKLRFRAAADCRLEELSRVRSVGALQHDTQGAAWDVQLDPYDLVAVQLNSANAVPVGLEVAEPEHVKMALEQKILELSARAAVLRNPPPWKGLQNPGFEKKPAAADPIPGWLTSFGEGGSVTIDRTHKHAGDQSVHLHADDAIVSLVSQPFPTPNTGRLWMWVSLRIDNPERQPPLRITLEGRHQGAYFSRSAILGKAAQGAAAPIALGTNWAPYVIPIGDLPLKDLKDVRVRFDLLGPGDVWIDDIELATLRFARNELTELSKLIYLLNVKLDDGKVGDCMRLLEGYWPRFLTDNVAIEVAAKPAAEPPKDNLLNRVKQMIPRL